MESHPKQLPIPGPVCGDIRAVEILRVWAAGGKQHVSLNPSHWDDPANWGILLVDLAKHVANAYEQAHGMNHSTALDRLKAGFDAEWGSPTDTPTGTF